MSDESPRPEMPPTSSEPIESGQVESAPMEQEPPQLLPPPFAPPPMTPPPNPPPHFAPPPNAPPPFAQPAPMVAPPLEPPAFEAAAFAAPMRTRRGRPVLGASLWIFGALLWAYVVMGEWVLKFELPEAFAALAVLAAAGMAWLSATRHLTQRPQQLTPAALGVGLFVVTLIVSTMVATHRRSVEEGVAVLMWFFSAGVYFLGRYLTARPRETRTSWPIAATVAFWLMAGVGTLGSLMSILTD